MDNLFKRLNRLREWFHREGLQSPAEIVLASRDDHVALFMRLQRNSEYAAIAEQIAAPKVGVPDEFEVMGIRFRSPELIEKCKRPWEPVEVEEDLPMLHRISAGRR